MGRSTSTRRTWSFIRTFLELQVPMVLGAVVCYLLGLVIASAGYAAVYHPGTWLFTIGDVLYLSVPVVVWMLLRGYSRRRSLEMAVSMIAPVIAIIALGQLAVYDYLTWLVTAGYPAMSLGMLVYMLYRRNLFAAGRAGHAATSEPVAH